MLISSLLFFLCLALLIIAIWGMIKPGKSFLGRDATRGKVLKVYGLAFFASFALFIYMLPDAKNDAVETAKSDATPAAQSPAKAEAARKKGPDIPELEASFISVIVEAQQSSRRAENDMQRGGIKAGRDKKLCEVMTSFQVTDWVGTVAAVGANSDGKGVLEIQVAKDITIKTWNNELSDMFDKTLIQPGTPVFNAAANLKKGQTVKFSGIFLKGDSGDCIRESSLSLIGKIADPEFIFRFSQVSPI